MPIDKVLRGQINDYCKRDLQGDVQWYIDQFSFIDNVELRKKLGRAFYSARYIGKLMEALHVSGEDLHPFVKFQIIQYASIYEAVVSYLLWNNFKSHEDVKKMQTHKSLKKVEALGKLTKISYEDEAIYTCVIRDKKTAKNSIPFKEKIDCAVSIGFVEKIYGEDIKLIYELRNLTHIETEAIKSINVKIEQSKKGYWRMKPFLDKIRKYFEEGHV